MKKIFYLAILFILCGFNTNYNNVKFSKVEKQQIAYMVAFDFFINFDLAIKNEDLSIIFDYIPNINLKNVKKAKLKTNVGYTDSSIDFQYNDDNFLTQINYLIDDKEYIYEIEYTKQLPTTVKLNGKVKYVFVYEKKLLARVLHYKNNQVNIVFYVNYQHRHRAKLTSKIADGGILTSNNVINNLKWNTNFKLTDYDFMKFKVSNITYDKYNNIASFTDNSPITKPNKIIWNYTYNNQNNWLKRDFKKVVTTREIIYHN